MTAVRSIKKRLDHCCVCNSVVPSTSATTSDPEAPEMIQLPAGAWFGMVGEPGEQARLVVCCTKGCLLNLLREEK